MTSANTARQQGDQYQAREFWWQLCRMFDPHSKVRQVGFEVSGVKGFDDVGVFYRKGMLDENRQPLIADYYQIKHHITNGAIRCQDLTDPAFLHAESVSLLQRLQRVQQTHPLKGVGIRFIFYNTWGLDPHDKMLKELVNPGNGSIRPERLAKDGLRSDIGKLRAAWREHLKIDDDAELLAILRPLRIMTGLTPTLQLSTLNDKLRLAGFVPVDEHLLANPYDDLALKLLEINQRLFTRPQAIKLARQHQLWKGQPMIDEEHKGVAIRSFLRWTEYLEDEVEDVGSDILDLLPYFDVRQIKNEAWWNERIVPEVVRFTEGLAAHPYRYRLHLHCHSSIGFLAGYCLPSKSGVDIVPMQSSGPGRRIAWQLDSQSGAAAYPAWQWSDEPVGDGGDLALALSVTQNTVPAVRRYLADNPTAIGKLVVAQVEGGPSPKSVQGGDHAQALAEQLVDYLKDVQAQLPRRGTLHIFASAPIALLFLIGRLSRGLGRIQLYEYPFDNPDQQDYIPSIKLLPTY